MPRRQEDEPPRPDFPSPLWQEIPVSTGLPGLIWPVLVLFFTEWVVARLVLQEGMSFSLSGDEHTVRPPRGRAR